MAGPRIDLSVATESHITAGADIDLIKRIDGAPTAPWLIRFWSTGTYQVEYAAKDGASDPPFTDPIPAVAGGFITAPAIKMLAATTPGLKFTAEY
jgi:hypothetical protein